MGNLDDSIVWTSSLAGAIGAGPTLSWAPTSADVGFQVLEASATDGEGLSTGEQVGIEVINDPPFVAGITATPSVILPAGTSVLFSTNVSDPNEPVFLESRILWRSDVEGPLGSGSTVEAFLTSVGPQTIRVTATDELGLATTRRLLVLVVESGQLPSISVSTPQEISRDGNRFQLLLSATVTDPQDGPLDGGSVVWRRTDTSPPQFVGSGASVVTELTAPRCVSIPFEVTATDSDGNNATAMTTWVDLC